MLAIFIVRILLCNKYIEILIVMLQIDVEDGMFMCDLVYVTLYILCMYGIYTVYIYVGVFDNAYSRMTIYYIVLLIYIFISPPLIGKYNIRYKETKYSIIYICYQHQ